MVSLKKIFHLSSLFVIQLNLIVPAVNEKIIYHILNELFLEETDP